MLFMVFFSIRKHFTYRYAKMRYKYNSTAKYRLAANKCSYKEGQSTVLWYLQGVNHKLAGLLYTGH